MVQWHVLDWVSLIVQSDWIMSHRAALVLIDIPFPSQTNDCFQVESQSQNDPRNRALQKKRGWERSCNYRRHWSRYDDNITCVYGTKAPSQGYTLSDKRTLTQKSLSHVHSLMQQYNFMHTSEWNETMMWYIGYRKISFRLYILKIIKLNLKVLQSSL